MAKNQKKKAEETVSPGGDQMPAADQHADSQDACQQSEQAAGEQTGDQQADTQDAGNQADQSTGDQAGDVVADGPAQLRYVGKTIKHFDHQGKIYQLIPNTVYLNLPADAEQVKRLIDNKELIGV